MAQIIPYLLLAVSIILETAKNVFSNDFSKNVLKNETDIYKFNVFTYIGSFLALCFFEGKGYSLFTIITAFFFALAVWLNQYFLLKALNCGSMAFTSFINGTALIIPIIYGVSFLGDKIYLKQIIYLVMLIIGMALALNVKKEKLDLKWLAFSGGAMLFLGIVSILQFTHQTSSKRHELVDFLRLAFLFAIIINLFGWLIKERKVPSGYSIKSKAIPMALFSGIFMGLVHIINLYLSGVIDKVIFYPVSNGGLIFITLIAALIFFKERLKAIQWVGIIIGIIALSLIGV